jgi:glutaredoxin
VKTPSLNSELPDRLVTIDKLQAAVMETVKPANLGSVRVTLYTRPGCHLCDEAKEAMAAANCATEYILEELNIENDPRLLHLYRHDIPIVMINGAEAFRHRVTPADFRHHITMAARSASDTPQK